jgi:GPR1/FUN34/yaaH family
MSQSTEQVSDSGGAAGPALAAAARPGLADPGAWAVTAFATTSFMLGMYNANLINAAGAAIVIPVALFFGGLIQIIVAILEIFRGNLFGAPGGFPAAVTPACPQGRVPRVATALAPPGVPARSRCPPEWYILD